MSDPISWPVIRNRGCGVLIINFGEEDAPYLSRRLEYLKYLQKSPKPGPPKWEPIEYVIFEPIK